MKTIKAFICLVENLDGNKQPKRVFAETAIEAKQQLTKEFTDCCVGEAIPYTEYVKMNRKVE